MTIEELTAKVDSLEVKVDYLVGIAVAEAERKAASELNNPFNQAAAPKPPAIPNTIEQVPRVGDIRAEKLAFITSQGGRPFWAAVIEGDNGDFYNEVEPYRSGDCKAVPGCFGLGFTFSRIPPGTQYLRKELGEWFLEQRPVPGCRAVKGSWDLTLIG